ncbi:hypothetical protein [Polyangium aurulentum]|uniref:hypothetical protein n=1 Tax=Polyangium aurulentum TaxID=2567896 RepID=UPI0010AE4C10|nr:hypothetical protein [Polyangium aurulentum]UQA56782.1 hypothetical protein E8A73_036595 [Polyangium aurulentum]
MKSLPPLVPRPSVILVLELLGIDDPSMPEGRRRQAFELVEQYLGRALLGDKLAKRQGLQLLVTGRQVIRIAPIKPGGTRLFDELLDIVHLQGDLILEGVFIRGALTLGDVATRVGRAVGSGIDHAARLCTEVADVPRVIVDPRLIREAEGNADLRAEHHAVPQELGYIRDILRRDGDGLWFVDYLKACASEVEDHSAYVNIIDQHGLLIEQRLNASVQLDGTSRTWTWLWQYHNMIVGEWQAAQRDNIAEWEPFFIPSQSPLVYAFPPSIKPPR